MTRVLIFLLVLVIQSAVGQSHDSISSDDKYIGKKELECLISRINEYTDENQLILIVLSELCTTSNDSEKNATRGVFPGHSFPGHSFPDPDRPRNEKGAHATSNDIIFITFEELQCMKHNFDKLINDPSDYLLLDSLTKCDQSKNPDIAS